MACLPQSAATGDSVEMVERKTVGGPGGRMRHHAASLPRKKHLLLILDTDPR